jgi:ERCC4-type nuclease
VTIEVDIHEPTDIIRFLEPTPIDIKVTGLNDQGFADYYWTGELLAWYPGHDGSYQIERKTATDLAGGADGIEEQIRREIRSHPGSYFRLIIEGNLEPAPGGGVIAYQRASGRDVMLGRRVAERQQGLYKKNIGQLAGWSEFIEVIPTTSYASTAATIVELYQRDQRSEDERSTFRRFFKTLPNWNPNPQVMRLLGLALNDTGVGVELAARIIEQYGTVWSFIHADPKEAAKRIRGISEAGVRQFQRKMGRLDV